MTAITRLRLSAAPLWAAAALLLMAMPAGDRRLGLEILVGLVLAGFAAERRRLTRENARLQAQVDRLSHAADHDGLTGLLNRTRFHAALQRHLVAGGRTAGGSVVLFIDVDDFKVVNDTHGHAVGDELLRCFARRLRDQVRDTDLVARLGGDEFAVLMSHARAGQAHSLVRDLAARLSLPYDIEGTRIVVSASIGVASNAGPGDDAAELLKAADAAMYRAKAGGKCRFAVSG